MLNPSTADAYEDDATIRKCMGFARTWAYDGIEVVNLFAWRARDPLALLTVKDPVGRHNRTTLAAVARVAEAVVCAWGCDAVTARIPGFAEHVSDAFSILSAGRDNRIQCLGRTKAGSPRHPLLLAYSTQREEFLCSEAMTLS